MVAAERLAAELRRLFPQAALVREGVWAVGGAVRDILLDRPPADLDLVTVDARSAAKDFASRSFGTFVDLGRETFPTFRIVVAGRIFDFSELTGGNIVADLGRRDFTINAMAVELGSDTLIDSFDGRTDLSERIVRMVSEQNLIEDPLRILKSVRTACTLGFTIEPATLRAGKAHAARLSAVAGERLRVELVRALDSERAGAAVRLLREMDLAEPLFGVTGVGGHRPPLQCGASVASEESEAMLASLPAGRYLVALALLLRSFDSAALDGVATRLRLSADERRALGVIHALSIAAASSSDDALRMMIFESGRELSEMAGEFARRCGEVVSAKRFESLSRAAEFFVTVPLLSGNEIAAILEVAPGPEIGRAKRAMLTEQLAERILTREQAVAFVSSLVRGDL